MIVPAPAQARHALMDAGRGFAILGILWLNIFVASLPFEALAIPGIWGNYASASYTMNIEIWRMIGIFVDGVMRCMISMLFGASALIMLGNAEASGRGIAALDPFFRRLLLLIGLGLLHAYVLLWPYDILFLYGLFGLFLFPFRNLPARTLVAIGGVLVVFSMLVGAEVVSPVEKAANQIEQTFDDEQIAQARENEVLVEQFNGDLGVAEAGPGAADVEADVDDPEIQQLARSMAEEILARRQGYIDNVVSLASASFEEQTSEVLSHHFLDVVPMLLFGMALLKSGFLTGDWPARRYAAVALGGFAVGWLLGWFPTISFEEGGRFDTLQDAVMPYLYEPRRIAFALAHFSWIALALRAPLFGWLTDGLRACGRMALSLYVAQTMAYGFLFYGFGLGLFGALEHVEIALIAIALTLVQFVAAPIYLRVFAQGPLEWALRRLVNANMPASVARTTITRHQPAE